jgi:Leucine-rich repeat (LRR) protein
MLPELTYLNLSNNYIQVIPKTIKNLQVRPRTNDFI